MVSLKLQYDSEIRRIQVSTLTYESLYQLATQFFPEVAKEAKLTFKYRDDEGDIISISSEEELQEALHLAGDGIVRLRVFASPSVEEETLEISLDEFLPLLFSGVLPFFSALPSRGCARPFPSQGCSQAPSQGPCGAFRRGCPPRRSCGPIFRGCGVPEDSKEIPQQSKEELLQSSSTVPDASVSPAESPILSKKETSTVTVEDWPEEETEPSPSTRVSPAPSHKDGKEEKEEKKKEEKDEGSKKRAPQNAFEEALFQIEEMGFSDRSRTIPILLRHRLNVPRALNDLLE